MFTKEGKTASLDDVVSAFGAASVVLLGEAHDDPVAHQLQLYLLIRAEQGSRPREGSPGRPVILSLEQFESDVQTVLDEYLAGTIREQDLLMDARPWSNYLVDYRPLVEYARRCGLPVIAANVPRRYVTLAGTKGLDRLPALVAPAGLSLLPPLPIAEVSADYRAHFSWAHGTAPEEAVMAGEAAQLQRPAAEEGHGGGCPYIGLNAKQNTLLDPIILWDAGMAHAIMRAATGGNLAAPTDQAASASRPLVLHICGSFHSEFGLGIGEFLRNLGLSREGMCIVTMYPSDQIHNFDVERHMNAGDFVILTDASLPRSHEGGAH